MAWLDLLILVSVVLSIAIGYKRGFIMTLFSLGSYIVAFIVSKNYYAELAQWIKTRFSFTDKLYGYVADHVELNIPTGAEEVSMEGYNSDQIAQLINQDSTKMPGFIQNLLVNELEVQTFAQQTVDGIKNQVIDTLATLFLNVISMIILFILIRGTIILIGMVINKVFELPILGALNHMVGGILGGIRGIFIVIFILFILIPMSVSSPQGIISTSIENSYLVQFLLNNVVIYFVRGLGAFIS